MNIIACDIDRDDDNNQMFKQLLPSTRILRY